MNTSTKPLRFAALIRVSTEQQEKTGESLHSQRSQNQRNVSLLGGSIVGWYGGQEHATPGYEKKEVDRLVADAGKGKFDAVIVCNADRWSRDNAKSSAGLDAFKTAGVRFYVGVSEYNLFDPEHQLFLGMSAVIGRFQAANQAKKSVLNRIERAKKNVPASGKLPFGRTFDAAKGWGIDAGKQAMIAEVARRYLAGESLSNLATEFGQNHSNLCKLLRERCGEKWEVGFDAAHLNISESVTLTVPRLLPEATITAIKHHLKANRTYAHKPPKSIYNYTLSGRIFCSTCGYCMFGQINANGHRYYRHAHANNLVRKCPLRPRPWVRADLIEGAVVRDLFDTFGNPAAIERAVKSAVPDSSESLARRDRLDAELDKIGKARGRVLDLIEKDLIDDAQAATKLRDLKDRVAVLRAELDSISAALIDLPDEPTIRRYVERITSSIRDSILVYDESGEPCEGGNTISTYLAMTDADRLALVKKTFDGPLPGGKPAGVYITPSGGRVHGPKRFTYELKGRLSWGVVPRAYS